MEYIICISCKKEKQKTEFYANKTAKSGLSSTCISCTKIKRKKYYNQNKEKILNRTYIYAEKNKDKIKARNKEYREKNAESLKKSKKQYAQKNKKQISDRNKNYRLKNKKKLADYGKKYRAERMKKDPSYALSYKLRTRLYVSIKLQYGEKAYSTNDLIGCTIEELRIHLEKQFNPGMSWDNHAKKGWHIDHIKPCASFDLTDPEQQKECFHFSNLQPLWWYENLEKRSEDHLIIKASKSGIM